MLTLLFFNAHFMIFGCGFGVQLSRPGCVTHHLTALKPFLFPLTYKVLTTLANATINIDKQLSPQKVSPKPTTVFMTNRRQQRILDSCELYTKRWTRRWRKHMD